MSVAVKRIAPVEQQHKQPGIPAQQQILRHGTLEKQQQHGAIHRVGRQRKLHRIVEELQLMNKNRVSLLQLGLISGVCRNNHFIPT
ncbi:hypothetical protein Ga0074115_1246 [endosymbiont of Ridgeia piscesae]|jgi:hypothetical protein|uniref:Uncharacterized protein n=2 Tax=endosymbiont of Ridgeia piscesae TaxID=54398 RepID=A0A0T5YZ38_9GAMM|nr:hypothetical protein Ga0074115_1246 [endosymbiont of Ridgeia piscesae]